MSISNSIKASMEQSSWIRKMFEEGLQLKAKVGEDNVFDFSLGNPDVPPPPEFFKAVEEICSKSKSDQSVNYHGYMANAGFMETRNAVAQRISADHGIKIGGNNVIMTCGAAGGLNIVFKTILNPGEEIIVPKPFFFEYVSYAGNHNGKIVLAETNEDFSLNVENIKALITDKTKGILINSPNNPTGKIYSEKEINDLSELLKSEQKLHGRTIYLISDEPYREIVYNGNSVPSILKCYSNSILVTSFSKNLSLAGERIGYVAVNPSCEDADYVMSGLVLCNRVLGYVNAPGLMQRVISKIIDTRVDISYYKKRRDIFVTGLKNAGYKVNEPEGAFYIFPKSPIDDDIKFIRHLLTYNVLATPGVGFGRPGYFRISYAVPENMILKSIPKFKEALETIK